MARRSRRAPLESSFANLIEFAPDATIVVDPSGSIVFVNAQTERVFGRRRDELIGQPVEVLIPERYRAAHTGHRDGYFAEPRIRAMDTGLELLGLRSDGTEFPVEISLAPLETDVGLRTMAAIRDVTDRKRAEEERLQLASERGLRVQAERLVKRLEDIQAVTDAALATLSLDELLQELLERIRTGVQADAAAIMLLTPDGNALTVRAVVGRGASLTAEREIPIGEGPAGRIAATGEAVIIPDVRAEAVVSPFVQEHMRSMMGAPLLVEGRAIGVVEVGTEKLRAFTDEHLEFLRLVGDRAASAIDRAQLLDQVQRYATDLEQRVAERTAELTETNAELEAFAYSVSHDLRAPLRAMHGFAQALLEDHAGEVDETGKEYLGRINSAARRLDELIQDLLVYSRLGTSAVDLVPMDLAPLVDEAMARAGPEFENGEVAVRVEAELPRVIGHRSILVQVVSNLLENGAKFVEEGTRPEIVVRAERTNGRVRLWVEDNGIGIAPEHQERIFRVFERLHTTDAYRGTGIGLALVRKAMARMNGGAGVESEPGSGSRFWIELAAEGPG